MVSSGDDEAAEAAAEAAAAAVVKEEAVEENTDGQRPVSEHSCHHVRDGTTLKQRRLLLYVHSLVKIL